MKDVTTISKGNAEAVVVGRRRIGLIFNTRFIERIAANGARIGTNIPTPQGDRIPFFHFKTRSGRSAFAARFGFSSSSSIVCGLEEEDR